MKAYFVDYFFHPKLVENFAIPHWECDGNIVGIIL
jgi:hypothetical protein